MRTSTRLVIMAGLTAALGCSSVCRADGVPEDLVNALRICNAHAVGHESGHPDLHTEWHAGYEACSTIEPYVRRLLAPQIEAQRRAQVDADRESLERALRLIEVGTHP